MKPLLICDCDEVLLHMAKHFSTWLGETHAVDYDLSKGDMAEAIRNRDGSVIARARFWELLNGFFPGEMERQTLVPGARDALVTLSQTADIVILTNLADHCRDARIDQLALHGIVHRVETNQGGKGTLVAQLVAEHGHPVTVFVDDLPMHHDSVARRAPGVHRLHMVSEPVIAAHTPPAPSAHARIDDWGTARDWILARFAAGMPATA